MVVVVVVGIIKIYKHFNMGDYTASFTNANTRRVKLALGSSFASIRTLMMKLHEHMIKASSGTTIFQKDLNHPLLS